MAGHSHWAGIKHKKAAADKKRGKIFSRLAKAIMVAARQGGGNPDMNIKLKFAVDQAKSANMPKENIERAIKKGSGDLDGAQYHEIMYEGMGPGGVSILVEVLTDNRNRTVSIMRKIFDTRGGSMDASVAWNFNKMGVFLIPKDENTNEDDLTNIAIEGGAEDIETEGDYLEIITTPEDYESMKKTLEDNQIKWESAELTLVPKNTVDIEDKDLATKVLNLLECLDDNDDVQKVHTNCIFPKGMDD